MTVVHVLASTRADHGGTSRSVPSICEALAARDVEVHLLTATPPQEEQFSILPNEAVRTHVIEESGGIAQKFRSPFAFARQFRKVMNRVDPDLIHDHGAWLPSNVLAAWTAWRHDVPLVLSPRGMLTGWALSHGAWKKRAAWHGYQRWVVRQASCFHVTAQAEADGLRTLGFSQPAAVVPNGVNVPDSLPARSETGNRHALFLSRVHPKKGLPTLLNAWAQVRPEGWILEIVGPDDGGHRGELEAQAKNLELNGTVQFTGPVDDSEKWAKYASADLFLLPSHSENFGIVVAEALAAGVPVVATTETPWQELTSHGCGWRIEPRVDSLAAVLEEATTLTDDERLEMGERGRSLINSKYDWGQIASQIEEVYRWIVRGGEPPNSVRMN